MLKKRWDCLFLLKFALDTGWVPKMLIFAFVRILLKIINHSNKKVYHSQIIWLKKYINYCCEQFSPFIYIKSLHFLKIIYEGLTWLVCTNFGVQYFPLVPRKRTIGDPSDSAIPDWRPIGDLYMLNRRLTCPIRDRHAWSKTDMPPETDMLVESNQNLNTFKYSYLYILSAY